MGKNVERIGGTYSHDQEMWDQLEEVVKESGHPLRDVLESFPVYARRVNLSRFLVHYEIFKMIKDVPGSIVECGVYRGSSLLTFAKLLEIYCPGDRTRKVIGFDNFAGFTELSEEDGAEDPNCSKVVGGWNSSPYYNELLKHIDIFHADSFIPRAKRVELVVGNLEETATDYLEKNSGLRISLLHLDCDVYKPTMAALEAFYPLVVPGGIVLLDEYGMAAWGGESAAFDEYFGKDTKHKLKTFPLSSTPTAYFIKGETV
ncbi:MAG: TylF/MycF/NovP-related O-methyltransferase [Pseudomonadota bacterium]